ncbi:hypothetical protein KR026_009598, partial [Drosophila bipectinata]
NMGYFIEMKDILCEANPDYFKDFSCRILQPKNRSLEASVNILQAISNGFTGSLRVSIPKAKRVMTQIFEITFDVCKVLREGKRRMLIDLLVNTLARSRNPKSFRCPFPKGKFVSNNITVTDLPPMLTESDFLVHLDFFVPKVANAMNITLNGHLFDVAKEKVRKRKFL